MSLSRLFPLWAALVAVLACLAPDAFRPLLPWVADLLTIVMLGLGVTLTVADFRRVVPRPAPVVAGVAVHCLVMPFVGWAIAHALAMSPELTTGMILVGSVASGTGSTLMVFLAGGDVALSVTVAALSTLVGISIAAILAMIGAVVAGSRGSIVSVGPLVLLAVVLHNGIGLLGGCWGGRLLGCDEGTCRRLAPEVGMRNSGLAAAPGRLCFSPLAALPGALFSVWHDLSGPILAASRSGRNPVEAAAPARALAGEA